MIQATLSLLTLITLPMHGQTPPKGFNLPSATMLASKVQAYYLKTTDFKASFKQTYTKPYHSAEPPSWGYMWVKKPGFMRWDYTSPRNKQLICDGKKIWIYDKGYKQVFWRNVSQSVMPTAVSFLWGKGDIHADFWVKILTNSKYSRAGAEVLKLEPKLATTTFKHLLFVVNSSNGMVHESIIFDHTGNKNHFVFSGPQVNTSVPTSQFSFTPPRGVRVIQAKDDTP